MQFGTIFSRDDIIHLFKKKRTLPSPFNVQFKFQSLHCSKCSNLFSQEAPQAHSSWKAEEQIIQISLWLSESLSESSLSMLLIDMMECMDTRLLVSLSIGELRLSLSEEEEKLLLSLSDTGFSRTTCFPAIKNMHRTISKQYKYILLATKT